MNEPVVLEHRGHMCHCIFFTTMSLHLAQSLEYSTAVYFPWIHEVTMRTQLFHPAIWLHSSHRLSWLSAKSPTHSRSLILCSEGLTGKTTLNLTCRELTLVTLCNTCPLWVLHCCCFDYYLYSSLKWFIDWGNKADTKECFQKSLNWRPLLGLNRKQKIAALLNEIVERTRAEFLKPPLFPVKFLSGSHFTRKDERCPA